MGPDSIDYFDYHALKVNNRNNRGHGLLAHIQFFYNGVYV